MAVNWGFDTPHVCSALPVPVLLCEWVHLCCLSVSVLSSDSAAFFQIGYENQP